MLAYVISGPKGTIAAIFLASRILSIAPLGRQGLKLAAIAAAVIGSAIIIAVLIARLLRVHFESFGQRANLRSKSTLEAA